jgi:hypothetical protein
LPYPWPYDGDLSTDRFALLVVQQDVFEARPSHLDSLRSLASSVSAVGVLVVALVHGDGPVRVHGDVTVRAPGRDAFYATALDDVLRRHGRDHLALAGSRLEVEVHSTLRSANDRGYECLTLIDACQPADPTLVYAASSMIQMSGGIFGAVGTSQALLAALHAARPHAARPHGARSTGTAPSLHEEHT